MVADGHQDTKRCEACGQVLKGRALALVHDAKLHGNSTYSQAIADRICAGIAAGLSLKAVCEMDGMPELHTVFRWRREHPSFDRAYASAREDAADTMADEIMAISDDRSADWKQDPETGVWKPDHDHIQRAKLRVDTRKWIAAKLKPATYGERVEANISGTLTQRNVNVNIDASHLTVEQREALRAVLLPKMSGPNGEAPEDS